MKKVKLKIEYSKLMNNFLKIPISGKCRQSVFGKHKGHSVYTGWGNRKSKGDYWDCYCLPDRGQLPPNNLRDLLKWVDNPDDIMKWKEKYEFDMIICYCGCCHGAEPMLIYGWLDGDKVGTYDIKEFKKKDVWTAKRTFHGFYVNGDRLSYFGDQSYV